ncbi:hypothetical protein Micbo1qcDRAFT_167008 [Microdochium bolleyi]|uniref:Rhodopsin domain-containing protein n=1 Tax=Microdochium bolleyi TaxID=196109 RepID=A0A136ISC7_9PEZI|nr:hypothetical protein Micbo1qcDRAFT_167008 [Microdochium bolleyi]
MVSPEAVIAAEWTLVTLAYVFLGLRLSVRITQRQLSNLLWSEVWLVLGALALLGLVICDTLTYHVGAMDEFTETTVDIMKIRFATNYLFDAGLYFPKLSMLTIYLHILPRYEQLHRWALYFVGVFTVASFLVTVFVDTFLCGPDPAVNWSTEPDSCSSFTSPLLFRLNWSLCFTTEAMLFLLPLPLLRTLRTAKRRELAGLSFLFGLGIITLSVSAGRFATMITLGNDVSLYIWATAEFSISQIIVSSMALRPLMKRVWRNLSLSRRSGDGGRAGHDASGVPEELRGSSAAADPSSSQRHLGPGRRNTTPSCGSRANPLSGQTGFDLELGDFAGVDHNDSDPRDDGKKKKKDNSRGNDSGIADVTQTSSWAGTVARDTGDEEAFTDVRIHKTPHA